MLASAAIPRALDTGFSTAQAASEGLWDHWERSHDSKASPANTQLHQADTPYLFLIPFAYPPSYAFSKLPRGVTPLLCYNSTLKAAPA